MTHSITETTHLTDTELARRWRLSVSTLRKWRLRGGGPPFVRLGRAVRYDLRTLENWLAASTVGASQ
ncbi:MAG: helix-turn-helix domain-containing protein [Acidobacteriota bacterium]